MTHFVSRFLTTATMLLLAAGCSVAPKYQPSQPPVDERTGQEQSETAPTQPEYSYEPYDEPAQTSPMPSPETQQPAEIEASPQVQQNPAVIALLNNADQSRASGDYRAAQGSLQRAQRIAPRDPEVYYSLALTHLELEDYALAEQVALKGVSVAQGNRTQLKKLWQLIAKIRMRAGDAAGSRDASLKADSY